MPVAEVVPSVPPKRGRGRPPHPPPNTTAAAVEAMRSRARAVGEKPFKDATNQLGWLSEQIDKAQASGDVRVALAYAKEFGIQLRHTDKALAAAEAATARKPASTDWKRKWSDEARAAS